MTHAYTSRKCVKMCKDAYTLRKKPAAAAAAKLHQSCLTLCDPMDDSPPGRGDTDIKNRLLDSVREGKGMMS